MDLSIPKVSDTYVSLADIEGSLHSLSKEDAIASLQALVHQESEDWFRMGMVLSSYKQSRSEDEFRDLAKYAEANLGVTLRKAYYLISIYDSLIASNITIEQVSQVGWTKLKEIAKLLTQDNVEYWVDTAKANSTKQLIALLKSNATSDSTKSEALDAALEATPAVVPVEPLSTPVDDVIKHLDVSPSAVSEPNAEPNAEPEEAVSYTFSKDYLDTPVTDTFSNTVEFVTDPTDDILAIVDEVPLSNTGGDLATPHAVVMPNITLEQLVVRLDQYTLDVILTTLKDIYPHVTIKVLENKDADSAIID